MFRDKMELALFAFLPLRFPFAFCIGLFVSMASLVHFMVHGVLRKESAFSLFFIFCCLPIL